MIFFGDALAPLLTQARQWHSTAGDRAWSCCAHAANLRPVWAQNLVRRLKFAPNKVNTSGSRRAVPAAGHVHRAPIKPARRFDSHRTIRLRSNKTPQHHTMACTLVHASRPRLNFVRLARTAVLDQLKLDEALMRASTENWCVVNRGAIGQRAIVLGIGGKVDKLVHARACANEGVALVRRCKPAWLLCNSPSRYATHAHRVRLLPPRFLLLADSLAAAPCTSHTKPALSR